MSASSPSAARPGGALPRRALAACAGRAVLLALAALALASCARRDVETRPFHLRVTGPDGGSLAAGFTQPGLLVLLGTAAVPDATTFVVGGAVRIASFPDPTRDVPVGDVTVRFDPSGDLAFPARLAGQQVLLEALVVPGATGPAAEPLPVSVVRIATGGRLTPTYELTLGESAADVDGLAAIPVLLGPFFGDEDLPSFSLEEVWTEYEPARCGLVYLDLLHASGGSPELTLAAGETATTAVGARIDPWHVRHVLTWHRRGHCKDQSGTWTQIAAWR